MTGVPIRPRPSTRSPAQSCRRAAWRMRARWRHVTRRREAGGATVEFVITVPLLLFMILIIAQAAVWMHATHVAQAAATRALDAAAANGGTAAHGQDSGNTTLTSLGSGVLHDPHVTVTRTATDVHVEITGTAATVVPGFAWPVKATAASKVERFVPDNAG